MKDSKRLLEAFGENKIIEWRRSYTTAPPSLVDPDFVRQVGIDYYEQSLLKINPHYLDDAMTSILNTHCLHNPSENLLLSSVHPEYPMTESLQQCEERAYGYWMRVIAPAVKQGKRVLIVAHANTIRALVKAVDKIADEDIAQLKIPNGIPLVYTLDHDLKPTEDLTDDIGFQANYLVSARNHGKVSILVYCIILKYLKSYLFVLYDV